MTSFWATKQMQLNMYKCANIAAAKKICFTFVKNPTPLPQIKNAKNTAAKKVLCWHWIKSPAPLPQSQIWGHVCQVQVRIFNAMSLYHHPAYTLYLLHALPNRQFLSRYSSLGQKWKSDKLREIHMCKQKKEKYISIYFCRVVNFGSEDVGGGDVSSSSCHSDRHTPALRSDTYRCTQKHRCTETYREIVQRNTDIQTYTYTPHSSALAATATDTPHSCHTHAPALPWNILRNKQKQTDEEQKTQKFKR